MLNLFILWIIIIELQTSVSSSIFHLMIAKIVLVVYSISDLQDIEKNKNIIGKRYCQEIIRLQKISMAKNFSANQKFY